MIVRIDRQRFEEVEVLDMKDTYIIVDRDGNELSGELDFYTTMRMIAHLGEIARQNKAPQTARVYDVNAGRIFNPEARWVGDELIISVKGCVPGFEEAYARASGAVPAPVEVDVGDE